MDENNLIMKAYREDENPSTIKIDLKSGTYGYEMYRISLMLLDKIIKLNKDFEITEENINMFFKQLGNNYWNYYQQ